MTGRRAPPPALVAALAVIVFSGLTLLGWEAGVCTPTIGSGSCDGRLFILISKPSEILRQLRSGEIDLALLAQYSRVTALNASAGLLLAAVFAFTWFWAGARFTAVRIAGYAFVWFFQVVPYVAFAWIFSLFFGAFDKAVFGFLVAVFPIIGSLLTCLRNIPAAERELLRLYRASHPQAMRHLYLPNAASYLFGGLALAAPLSVVGVMIADLSGGSSAGLGRKIFTAVRNAEPAELWVYTAAAVLVSLALCAVVWLAELAFSKSNRWYSSENRHD